MLFSNDRTALRRMFADAWQRQCAGLPLEPLQAQIADVVRLHPEYHHLLEEGSDLEKDWTPEDGELNPFLHMSLHMAVREQCSTNRPAGIRDVRDRLEALLGQPHDAEHAMIEVLGEALWEAQRAGRAPDEQAYLASLQRLAGQSGRR